MVRLKADTTYVARVAYVASGFERTRQRIRGVPAFAGPDSAAPVLDGGAAMKTVVLELPTLLFVVGTRAALGVGIGLLVSLRLSEARRRAIGTALVTVGAVTTIPAARAVISRIRRRGDASIERDPRLIGATRLPRRG